IPETLSELCTDTALLVAAHGVDRREDLRLIAGLAGGPRQSGYILLEARATITGTRVQELVPDPGIGADPDANLLDIGSSALSNVGHLVDEADLRSEHCVCRVLGKFSGSDVHDDHLLVLPVVWLVAFPHDRFNLGGVGADDDTCAVLEVLDRGAFFKELRIRAHPHLVVHP